MTMKEEGETLYKKGLWTVEEDKLLMDYIQVYGNRRWNKMAKKTGLKRSGKSCRLRWMNYLSPNIKKGDFSEEEEDLIIRLHKLLGNRWSLIAKRVPGRTDNQVKNYWNSHLRKKLGIKDQNPKRVNSCRSCKKVKGSEQEAALDFSQGDGATVTATAAGGITMEIAVDNQSSQQQDHHQVLSTIQESLISGRYMNPFWVADDDLELSALDVMEYFDECSPFHLA